MKPTKETYYYPRNAQGDAVKLIDKTGATVVEYTYDTWGKLLSTTGSLAATFGAEQPFRYRGYVYDEETGFYYLQSRYYNPEVGRFISADVYLSTGQGVIGHNAYAYCGNNPVTRVDDEGEFWNIVIGAIVGAIVGAVVSAVTQAASGQDINWAAVGVAAACGALSGAVNAACPCMGVAATGLVQGSIGALEYAGTELAYGRTPTLEKTLMAGVTTGMFAAGGKFVAQSVGLTACFIAGTQVITTNGMVSIENISEGDYVYATDPETGESGFKRVVQTFERETDELVEITCDGETITTTPTHPFYVPQKGWTEAIKLRAGDILVTSNGEYVVVEKVQHEILEAPITVYNFEVEDYHTYYVSADANSDVFVLVHNKCSSGKTFRTDADLNNHFAKHGGEFEGMYGNASEYLNGANYVINNGTYVPKMNGYIKFFGSNGGANYAFVGMTHNLNYITTFSIRSVSTLIGAVPWLS